MALRDNNDNSAFDITDDDVIRELLACGAEKLYVAICQNDADVVTTLLQTIDVNTKFRFDVTPLHIACQRGVLKISELFILAGADINAQVRHFL